MENKYLGRAIGQEEETEVIMTGESPIEGYKKLMKMAENAEQAKRTNFEAITESPEKLAEYLSNISTMPFCEIIGYCDKCPLSEKCQALSYSDMERVMRLRHKEIILKNLINGGEKK